MTSPLKTFFSGYPKFKYKPRSSPISEFNRLSEKYQLKHGSAEKVAARDKFNLAMKKEFDSLYGSDDKDIDNWYKLCHVLKIDPAPNTLKECRAVVSSKHVNLVDLVYGSRENITLFKSEKDLSEYTLASKKFFPGEDAEDGGVLRALRRHIFVPRESRSKPGKSYHRRTVKSIPFGVPTPSRDPGSRPNPTLPCVPTLPYHAILATCIQIRLARQYNALMLQPSYPVYHLSQPRPSGDPA